MVTPDLSKQFREINKAFDRFCERELILPLPNKQIALMTYARFSATGYAVLIEDDPMEKYSSTRKAFAPVAYGCKTFSPAKLKMSIYAKEFLVIFFAFKEIWTFFGGTTKPSISLTDNKSVTRFFQIKTFSTNPVERVQLRYPVHFHERSYTWQKQHRSRLPVASRNLY